MALTVEELFEIRSREEILQKHFRALNLLRKDLGLLIQQISSVTDEIIKTSFDLIVKQYSDSEKKLTLGATQEKYLSEPFIENLAGKESYFISSNVLLFGLGKEDFHIDFQSHPHYSYLGIDSTDFMAFRTKRFLNALENFTLNSGLTTICFEMPRVMDLTDLQKVVNESSDNYEFGSTAESIHEGQIENKYRIRKELIPFLKEYGYNKITDEGKLVGMSKYLDN